MSLSASVFLPGPPLRLPADLDHTQRSVLVGLVLLAHAVLGAALWLAREPALISPPSSTMMVSLIAEEPAVQVSAPQPDVAQREPVQAPAPVVTPRPPVQRAPQVLASTAQAQEAEAPAPALDVLKPSTPVTPPSPAVVDQPAPALPAPASAAPLVKAPVQPKDLPSSAVRYLLEPPQIYPRVSRELGETGVVRLRLLIDEQGRLKHIEVVQSSGYPRLDQQALSNMRQARFQPLIDNGVPREVTTTASIVFSLEEP